MSALRQPINMRTPNDLSEFQHKNVLIIDDEPSMHHLFTTFLHPEEYCDTAAEAEAPIDANYNFEVLNAFNGEYGLEICAKQNEREAPIQTAFVDMSMNGWDGVETIKNLRKFDPRISFVIVTGFPEIAQREIESRLGDIESFKILPKPAKLKEIYETAYTLTKRWNQLHADGGPPLEHEASADSQKN